MKAFQILKVTDKVNGENKGNRKQDVFNAC